MNEKAFLITLKGNKTPITTLFLDIGGVLLTNGWDHMARGRACLKFQLNSVDFEAGHSTLFPSYERGEISLDTYLDKVVFNQGRSFTKQEFEAYIYSQSQPYEEMLKMIQTVKEKHNLKVFSVNNEGRELNAYRIATFKLDLLIDAFISSCYVGLSKPDPRLYQLALDIAHVSPQQVLYIDDRTEMTQVASLLGLITLHHTDIKKTIAAIHKLI